MAVRASCVDLGFAGKCAANLLSSGHFPSKIGGKPAWLSLSNLPTQKDLQCTSCEAQLVFLCQIYSPYEEDDANFHRTLFVFICRSTQCSVRNDSTNILVLRSCLPRKNEFYNFEPPDDCDNAVAFDYRKFGFNMCCCGCLATKVCSKCKKVFYCCKDHQVFDWSNHKKYCPQLAKNAEVPAYEFSWSLLYPEFEIINEQEANIEDTKLEAEDAKLEAVDAKVEAKDAKMEAEDAKLSAEDAKLEAEGDQLKQLEQLNISGTLQEVSEEDLQAVCIPEDRQFSKFQKRIASDRQQVVRFERGGEPLYIAECPKVNSIPKCVYCDGERQFEFQIMPQMLCVVDEIDVDFGIVAVYTCKKSCTEKDCYKVECAFKQDVAEQNF